MDRLYLITYNHNEIFRGKVGRIIGMCRNIPRGIDYYIIRFEDNSIKNIEVGEVANGNWRFVTISELLKVGMP